MESTAYDFSEEMIMKGTNQILHGDLKGIKMFYKGQEAIMKGLDRETENKFEGFASNMLCISIKECVAVCKDAFLDGLYLGHKASRQGKLVLERQWKSIEIYRSALSVG